MIEIEKLLIWIGLLEGEGCFHLNKNTKQTQVKFSNTNVDLIKFYRSILDQLYVPSILTIEENRNKISYNIIALRKRYVRLLYNDIEIHMQCRIDEYQNMLGLPTTIPKITPCLLWSIGIIEAEGCISIKKKEDKRGYTNYIPVLEIVNTNSRVLEKFRETLKFYEIFYTNEYTTKYSHKSYERIKICRRYHILKFIGISNLYWISEKKKSESKLMEEFIKSRMARPDNSPYSDREIEIYEELREIKR